MKKITVEICCGSADDVFRAKEGGAHRVELNACLFQGGLTPSLGTMTVARQVDIEIMAMVRPREGGFCYTQREFEAMLLDARALLDAGADGIVFGFLHQNGTVDVERCRQMLEVIGGKQSVFHRAMDVVPDWREALDILIDLGVTRVLTSGQEPAVRYGADTVRAMMAYAAGRIEILPGGGVRAHNVEEILEKTGCDQIHASMGSPCEDRSATGNPAIHFSGALYAPETTFAMTDSGKVKAFVDAANR